MNDYNFGNFVCMLREKKGLTQADIAERLGVTAAAVSKWENGSSKPRVEVLFKLAEILGVRPDELMAGHYIEEIESDAESDSKNSITLKLPRPSKKAVTVIICAVILFNIILAATIITVVTVALDVAKSTEEYKLAYEYIIESDKFAELGISEDDLTFNTYRRNKIKNADGDRITNVMLGFRIGSGRTLELICHDDGEGWYVCPECTKFE